MAEEPQTLVQPKPRRYYDLSPTSTNSSGPPSPLSRLPSNYERTGVETESFQDIANRSRSILNLTSSTLTGIYKPLASGVDPNRSEPSTPFGNGTQTPGAGTYIDDRKPPIMGAYVRFSPRTTDVHQQSHQQATIWEKSVQSSKRIVLLFLFGVAYGIIITSLRDSQQVVPVQVELKGFRHNSWGYLIGWGGIGILLGSLLPWVDLLWEEVLGNNKHVFASKGPSERPASPTTTSPNQEIMQATSFGSGLGADWNPVVRSIGAFIGIAFAIRKLPWQSTSQISLTLALVNPVLWYLVDRSKPGFLLSSFVGLAGTGIAFGVNPEIVPPPSAPSPLVGPMLNVTREFGVHDGLISNESIGIGTWIASVLFCSSVCFGNIGRRLALGTEGRRPSLS